MNAEAGIKEKYIKKISNFKPVKLKGTIVRVVGLIFESVGPPVSVGEKCDIFSKRDISSCVWKGGLNDPHSIFPA